MSSARHHTVLIGDKPFEVPGSHLIDHTGTERLNLARARNTAGDAAVEAGADVIVFLDADCVPGPGLGRFYELAVAGCRGRTTRDPHSTTTGEPVHQGAFHPAHGGIYCGPVTYLPRHTPSLDHPDAWEHLPNLTAPHRARPDPPDGSLRLADTGEYSLFWSLSFAVSSSQWIYLRRAFGGFCEEYEGYGGEDTDFAMNLERYSIPLFWVGGAHAYHQWHQVSSPPVEHLQDIVNNAGLFFDRWGWWPMLGWLEEFHRLGLAHHDGQRWVCDPAESLQDGSADS